MKKKIGSPKLGLKLGFLPFSQICIFSFPWYCTALQLGTMSKTSTKKKQQKKMYGPHSGLTGPNCVRNDLFYSNVIVLLTINNKDKKVMERRKWLTTKFITPPPSFVDLFIFYRKERCSGSRRSTRRPPTLTALMPAQSLWYALLVILMMICLMKTIRTMKKPWFWRMTQILFWQQPKVGVDFNNLYFQS